VRGIGAYQANVAEVSKQWDGHLAKYMGDGVLVYFGWPQAHEDDAERAVRAGLDLAQTVAALRSAASWALQVRAGIATGQVVVGDLGSQETSDKDSVVGETPNLAARLQSLAEPGSIVISQGTRRLVSGLFELDDLGPQRLKVSLSRSPSGVLPAKAGLKVASKRGTRRDSRRWSGATKSFHCSCAAGNRRRMARGRLSCSRASPASASRAWCGKFARGSKASRTCGSPTSARPITPPARYIR
jgi:hypothetical protein